MTTEKIEVWLGYDTSEEQGKSVREAFSEAGLPVEIRYESAYLESARTNRRLVATSTLSESRY
jgi:hypothetical protein